ncbi:ABC transporter ATP-binding protein [uncultured Eubacterium sp.]|uniref:ABC transporter ATP-binding protein n=1 Tax=uncultured Eubacterium sp. TaxID=165185 RepID=UPI0025FAAF7D|nr:ABC transporter ATP-binding protein [uncultured Eubacterium sp.]
MGYAGSYCYLTYASWMLSALSAVLALFPFVFIWRIIREVLEVMPDYGKAQHISFNGWMAVLFALISMLIYICVLFCSHKAAFRVQANLRKEMIHHIVELPIGFTGEYGSGRLRKIVNETSASTETYLAHQMPDKAGALVTPVALLILLLVFDWRLGLLSLLPVVGAFLVMSSMTGKEMQRKMKEYQDSLENMSNEAVEYVRGIPVVKTFGQSVFSFRRFREAIDNYQKWVISYTKDLRLPMMGYMTMINAVFAFLIAGAMFFTRDSVTPEFFLNLMFYIILTPIITVTLNKIMYSSENEMVVADALQRMDGILQSAPLTQSSQPRQPEDASVTFDHVTFAYDNTQKNALEDVSLQIPAGSHVALVGPSGSGKSTLASLIARFHDASAGEVRIGNVPVKEIAEKQLMDTVSFVFQDSKLLKMSILDNVRLGRPEATREEVLQALHEAQCDDILAKFPEGVDTVIGAKGVYVSGGEAQRISIARAMLKNASILILDEATAFADPDNEVRVQQAFAKLSQGKTLIMIAHRLSTVVNADCIYVIRDGSVDAQGTHEELLAQQGLYADMWTEYNQAAKWKVGEPNA